MSEHGETSFDTGRILITRVKPATKYSFDSTRFKKDNKELYDQYLKETTSKEFLKLTIR